MFVVKAIAVWDSLPKQLWWSTVSANKCLLSYAVAPPQRSKRKFTLLFIVKKSWKRYHDTFCCKGGCLINDERRKFTVKDVGLSFRKSFRSLNLLIVETRIQSPELLMLSFGNIFANTKTKKIDILTFKCQIPLSIKLGFINYLLN